MVMRVAILRTHRVRSTRRLTDTRGNGSGDRDDNQGESAHAPNHQIASIAEHFVSEQLDPERHYDDTVGVTTTHLLNVYGAQP